MGCGDDQHLADPCQHQSADRVVDHWFVVDGQKLLAHSLRDRVETRATSTSQNDAAPFIGELSQNYQAISLIFSLGAPQQLVCEFLSGENVHV